MVDECIARRKRDMEKLSVMAVVNSREREIEMMEGEIERERERGTSDKNFTQIT